MQKDERILRPISNERSGFYDSVMSRRPDSHGLYFIQIINLKNKIKQKTNHCQYPTSHASPGTSRVSLEF